MVPMPRERAPKQILSRLGNIIADHRKRVGLTQRDLATVIGVGICTEQHWEQGLKEPGLGNLIRIAATCDVPLSVLLSPLDDFRLEPHPERGATCH